jgi:hypothetical protein
MSGDPHRLVDDHDVVVLVNDPKTGHALGRRRVGFGGPRQLDVEPGAAADAVRPVAAYSVESHRPGVDEFRGSGSGQPEQAGDSRVEAQPVEAVGHRDPTPVGRR